MTEISLFFLRFPDIEAGGNSSKFPSNLERFKEEEIQRFFRTPSLKSSPIFVLLSSCDILFDQQQNEELPPLMTSELNLRAATRRDRETLFQLHIAAFGRVDEAKLVIKLLDSDSVVEDISLVAISDDKIVGHILFTDLKIQTEDGKELTNSHERRTSNYRAYAIALAPLAVLPEKQKQGVGRVLMNESLRLADKAGHGLVVVLGHPDYYQKFGFEPASKFGMLSPFDVTDEFFMVKPLSAFKPEVCGNVVYHGAFADMD